MLAVTDHGHKSDQYRPGQDPGQEPVPDNVLLAVTLRPGGNNDLNLIRIILCLFAVLCLIVGLIFWLVGAGPVLPFMGIEILLLYAAYRFGRNRTRICEKISLTERDLFIRRTDHRGREQSLHLEPYWLVLKMIEEPGRLARLILTSKGRSTEIGAFLAPGERTELSRLLENSLKHLRPV